MLNEGILMTGETANAAKQADRALREFALGFPEAYEDYPWGERVIKVKGKVFVFLGVPSDGLQFTVKLPDSASAALMQPFAQPTGYGLAKTGWVTARFGADEEPPIDLFKRWIEESYRAVAPRKLTAQLSR